jgi:hypothetical protein
VSTEAFGTRSRRREIAPEFVHHGRLEHFERLKVFLLRRSDAPYAALAREMNISEGRSRWRFTGFASGIANSFARKLPILWAIPPNWSPNSGFWLPC